MATIGNTLTAIVANHVVKALPALHAKIKAPFLVNTEVSQDPARPGSVAQMNFYGAKSVGTRSVSNVFAAAGAATLSTETMTYSNNRYTDFGLEDSEATKIDVLPHKQKEIEACLIALAEDINEKIWACAEGVVYQAYGTGGTAPFGSGVTIVSAAKAAKLLDDEYAPAGPRFGVINGAALENARQVANFVQANYAGDNTTLRTGAIGRVYDIDWVADDGLYYHTAGTLSNGSGMLAKVNDASAAVGEETLSLDESTLTGTVTKGDIFTIAGDAQTYTATALATAAANAIAALAISPGLRVAPDNDSVVTFKGSYQANLVFQRDAIGAKNAPLSWEMGLDPNIALIRDPLTGWYFRLERQRQEGITRWIVDCLFGAKMFDPRRAMVLLG